MFRRIAMATVTAVSLLVTQASLSYAGWDPVKQAQDARNRAENSVRVETNNGIDSLGRAAGVHYSFTIQNPTNDPVYYYIGNMPCALARQTQTGCTGNGQQPTISFDNGRNQNVTYALENGQTYVFVWNQGVLDLVRR